MKNTKVTYLSRINYTALKEVQTIERIIERFSDSQFIHHINTLRAWDGSKDAYQDYKEKNLIAYSPNCLYGNEGNCKLTNVVSSTGLVYLDIDGLKSIEEAEQLKLYFASFPFVLACHLSVGGKGLGIIVRCDNVTINNFKLVWESIEQTFNIKSVNNSYKLDQKVKHINRRNYITYDPKAYINYECTSYTFDQFLIEEVKGAVSDPHININLLNKTISHRNCTFLEEMEKQKGAERIFHQTFFCKEFYGEKKSVTVKDGFAQVKLKLNPNNKIPIGQRSKLLLVNSNKLLLINMDITKEQLFKEVNKLNYQYCVEPLDEKEIEGIVLTSFKYYFNNTLHAKSTTQYITFNPYIYTAKEEKLSICRENLPEIRRNKTKQQILAGIQSIQNEGRKPTQKEVAELVSLSLRTVKTYWKEVMNLNSF